MSDEGPRFQHNEWKSMWLGRDGRFDVYAEVADLAKQQVMIVLRYSSDPSDTKRFTYKCLKEYPFPKFDNAVAMYEQKRAIVDIQLFGIGFGF